MKALEMSEQSKKIIGEMTKKFAADLGREFEICSLDKMHVGIDLAKEGSDFTAKIEFRCDVNHRYEIVESIIL